MAPTTGSCKGLEFGSGAGLTSTNIAGARTVSLVVDIVNLRAYMFLFDDRRYRIKIKRQFNVRDGARETTNAIKFESVVQKDNTTTTRRVTYPQA